MLQIVLRHSHKLMRNISFLACQKDNLKGVSSSVMKLRLDLMTPFQVVV